MFKLTKNSKQQQFFFIYPITQGMKNPKIAWPTWPTRPILFCGAYFPIQFNSIEKSVCDPKKNRDPSSTLNNYFIRKKMYQCSICTAGSTVCSLDVNQKCHVHIYAHVVLPQHAVKCQKHAFYAQQGSICLSKCSSGCVHRENATCRCTKSPIRLQVQKKNHNRGRYFWRCKACELFQW